MKMKERKFSLECANNYSRSDAAAKVTISHSAYICGLIPNLGIQAANISESVLDEIIVNAQAIKKVLKSCHRWILH